MLSVVMLWLCIVLVGTVAYVLLKGIVLDYFGR
mgnify:CR=1 FL=1